MKEKISINDFYALRRKLWVEAMCAVLSRYAAERSTWNTDEAAKQADLAVKQFDDRFMAVM